jgi:HEAT repeat protein
MKHIRPLYSALLALLLTFNPLSAQDNRTLDTKVADLLVQIPAGDQQKLNALMQSMLSLEKAGLQMILDMVIPPGRGDDTRTRMAIESLSRYLSQPGMEQEQNHWEAMILKEITGGEDPLVQSFFIRQLNYSGSQASLNQLSVYLTDPDLQDPAIRAMRDIDPAKAADLFAAQLQNTQGRPRIALVNAIKIIGNQNHADAVAALAGSGSVELQRSVLACLAVLGNPDSQKLLSDAAKKAGYMPESTCATGSFLVYASTLSEAGLHNQSLKISNSVIKKCSEPEQDVFKCAALVAAAGNRDIEQSVSLLVDAMKDKSKSYRMTAIRYAAANNIPLDPWIKAMEDTRDNEVKSEILSLFGMLKKPEATAIVSAYMDNQDAGVRQEAAKALALIRKSEAVPDLLHYTLSYPAEPDSRTAQACLLQTVGTEQLPQLTEAMKEAPEGAKVVLIKVIAAKGDPGTFDILYAQLQESPAIRSASIRNLYQVADQGDVGDLIRLFDQLEDKDELAAIETALVSAIRRGPYREVSTQALLLHAARTFTVENYIGVPAKVGGKEALEAVYETYTSGDEESRKRAFSGLIRSDDIYAAGPLFEIFVRSTEEKLKEAAFRNFLRIVSSSALPDDQKLLLVRKIEPYAGSAGDKELIIRAMGGIKTFLSFVCLGNYLEEDEVKIMAANALVRVVLPGSGMDNGMRGKLVKEKLDLAREIVSGPDSEYLKIDIQNYLDKMPGEKGFISMFNGTDLSGWHGLAADPLKKKELSEKELQELQTEADEKLKENWSVKDGYIVFNGKGSNLCSVKEYGSFELIVDWRITTSLALRKRPADLSGSSTAGT